MKKKYKITAFSKAKEIIYMGVVSIGLNADGCPTHIMNVDINKFIKDFVCDHRHNMRELSLDEFERVMGYDHIEIQTI